MTWTELVGTIGISVAAGTVLVLIALDIHLGLQEQAEREFAIHVATEFAMREPNYAQLRSGGLLPIDDQIAKLAANNVFSATSTRGGDWCASFDGSAQQPTAIVGKCQSNSLGAWEWVSDRQQHVTTLELLDKGRFAELAAKSSGS